MTAAPGVSPTNSPPKTAKTAAELADEALTARCEALDVPGYNVETDGVFTVVRRTSTPERSAAFPARIARWLVSSDKWLPYLYRFTRESVELAPWRMAILVLGKLVSSLSPTFKLWITSNLLAMVEQAVKTGHVNKIKLAVYAMLGAFFSTGISALSLFFARNAGVLERYFEAMVHTRLLNTIARLDYTAANSPENIKLLGEAASTIEVGSQQAFTIIGDVAKVFTSVLGVASQAILLRKTINKHNMDLIGISFAANLIRSASWLFRGDPGVQTAATNPHYQRMQGIWDAARDTSPEAILLQLPAYYAKEYARADAALGSTWTYRLLDKSRLARSTDFLARLSDPLVYTLFALRASARHRPSSLASTLFSDTLSMGNLAYIQNASKSIAEELASFFYTLDDVRQHCTRIIQFYRALDVKPAMQRSRNPIVYTLPKSNGLRGMSIQLRDVAFKYPSSEHYALKGVSCSFEPGTLTCIVGYNGAGKSTLINLLTRILDSSEGSVIINGHDAKLYTPEDLYRRISCQFQETEPADVTIREWLQMGDIGGTSDEATMQECIRIAGVEKVISRFPKGLDARLGPYPAHPTPASFLKDFVRDSQTGPVDPWETDYDKLVKKEIEEDEEWEDEVVGGAGSNGGSLKGKDCAFSPGEWQKLCFARSLMKKDADLRIFDEPSASLDPVASRQVFDKIDSLRGQSTVIHITHDLSACLKADQVIMFEDGKNIESGTHEGLLAQLDSQYRKFYLASLGQNDDDEEQEEADDEESVVDSEKTAVSEHDSDETAWEDEEADEPQDADPVGEVLQASEDDLLSRTKHDKNGKGRERSDSGYYPQPQEVESD